MEDLKNLIGKTVIVDDKRYTVIAANGTELSLKSDVEERVVDTANTSFKKTCLIGDIDVYDHWMHASIS